jgi:3-keto-5-aminohexanoate cleavage enzyme
MKTEPLIINLAPTGMVPTRAMTPHVPLQPEEIVAESLAAAELGASIVHIHARDASGSPAWQRDIYGRIISGVRERRPDLVICVSTSGCDFPEFDKRSDVLDLDDDLKPDMASLTLSSMNFARQANVNAPDMVRALAENMLANGIRPEFEVFDLGMVNYMAYLVDKLGIPGPHYVNLLVGGVASAQDDLLSVATLAAGLPQGSLWSLAGLGAAQVSTPAIAVSAAHGVRVGLEDYLWLDRDRRQLATNADLIRRVLRLARLVDRPIMTPGALRARLGLPDASEHAPRNAAVPLRLCSACSSPALSFETPIVVCLDCDGASADLPQRGDLFTAP